jgi:hypothetical protein
MATIGGMFMMLGRSLRCLGVAAALALTVGPAAAHHTVGHDQNPEPPDKLGLTPFVPFEAGSIIIPLDGCYQRMSNLVNDAQVDAIITPLTTSNTSAACNNSKDPGVILAYTLIFRIVQKGIPVHWAIKAGKTGWNDEDFSILRADKSPVLHATPGSGTDDAYSKITTVYYRGSAFVIKKEHAADAIAVMDSVAAMSNGSGSYADVDYHISQVGFDAPIYRSLVELPKLAVIDGRPVLEADGITVKEPGLTGDQTNKLIGTVSEAIADDLVGAAYWYVTIQEVIDGALIAKPYDLVWVPPFDPVAPPTDTEVKFMEALAKFADVGGSVLFQDEAIGAAEGQGTWNGLAYTETEAGMNPFMTGGGIIGDGISSTWGDSGGEGVEGYDYSDPSAQFGGNEWTGIGGSKDEWKPRYDGSYLPGVMRMVYTNGTSDDDDRWDLAAWRRKDNDPNKGIIFYLGGDHWRKNTASGFRLLLNTVLSTNANSVLAPVTMVEAARSAPIVATVGTVEAQFSGTFENVIGKPPATTYAGAANDTTFQFPDIIGHYRGIDLSKLAEGGTTLITAEGNGAVMFDAADKLPPAPTPIATTWGCTFPVNGSCRAIFSDYWGGTWKIPVVPQYQPWLSYFLDPSGILTDAEEKTVIERINAGHWNDDTDTWEARLGGIDRSTAAIIEPSPLTGGAGSTRPTMAYFGGTDGMLHAVCVTAGQGCPSAGVEMWAFMPYVEIGKVRHNQARIDGSPKVADIYANWGGVNSTKTVLMFLSGNFSATAGNEWDQSRLYALDITDPRNPQILWSSWDWGPGLDVALAWVRSPTGLQPLVVSSTSYYYNPWYDTWGYDSGYRMYRGVDARTGYEIWWTYQWEERRRDSANPFIPATAIVGGPSVVPRSDGTTADYVLVSSLLGRVYKLDAANGRMVYGAQSQSLWQSGNYYQAYYWRPRPLFDMETDLHPIGTSVSLYRNEAGDTFGVAVTGGFADPTAPSASSWAPDDVNQYAISFPINPDVSLVPITAAEVLASQGDPAPLGIYIDFGKGQRAFSPAIIAGNEVFIATDSRNINSADFGLGAGSGLLWRKNLNPGSAEATSNEVLSGAASVDISKGSATVVSVGAGSVTRETISSFDADGQSMEASKTGSSGRRLWLRTE